MAGIVFPDETSHYGSLYGGNALAFMAKAAFVAATRHSRKPVVMAASQNVEFFEQIGTGEIVEAVPWISATGTSSMTVEVELWAEALASPQRQRCGSASFVIVALGPDRRPVAITNRG